MVKIWIFRNYLCCPRCEPRHSSDSGPSLRPRRPCHPSLGTGRSCPGPPWQIFSEILIEELQYSAEEKWNRNKLWPRSHWLTIILWALSFRENVSSTTTHVALLHYHVKLAAKPYRVRAVVFAQQKPEILQNNVAVVISLHHPVYFVIEFLISFLKTIFSFAPYLIVRLIYWMIIKFLLEVEIPLWCCWRRSPTVDPPAWWGTLGSCTSGPRSEPPAGPWSCGCLGGSSPGREHEHPASNVRPHQCYLR